MVLDGFRDSTTKSSRICLIADMAAAACLDETERTLITLSHTQKQSHQTTFVLWFHPTSHVCAQSRAESTKFQNDTQPASVQYTFVLQVKTNYKNLK